MDNINKISTELSRKRRIARLVRQKVHFKYLSWVEVYKPQMDDAPAVIPITDVQLYQIDEFI